MTFKARVFAFALSLVPAVLATCLPAWAAEPDAEGVRTRVRDIDVEGLTQRLLIVSPPSPRAVLVMLPGGAGDIGIGDDGTLKHGENFLVRTRARFAAHGLAVVIVDAAGTDNLRGRRASPAYGRLVDAVARFAKSDMGLPVFLAGTSQGAIAAMNGAAHAAEGEVAGLILTESVSRLGGSKETVFDADPGAVKVPALIIANTNDACFVAPPADAERIAESLTGSPAVKVAHVSGGIVEGKDCSAHSPHGYWGIEDQPVRIMADWIDAQLAR